MAEADAVDVAGRSVPLEPPTLFTWAAGSFHAALLVAALVAGLHLADAAGDLLGAAGTLPGAVVYLYLWALSVWTTGRAFRASGVTPTDGVPDRWRALRAALVWGGATGLLFLWGLLVPVAVALVLQAGLDGVGFALVVGTVGGALSVVVGAAVGLLFALLDVGLLRVAAALATGRPPESGGPPAEPPPDRDAG